MTLLAKSVKILTNTCKMSQETAMELYIHTRSCILCFDIILSSSWQILVRFHKKLPRSYNTKTYMIHSRSCMTVLTKSVKILTNTCKISQETTKEPIPRPYMIHTRTWMITSGQTLARSCMSSLHNLAKIWPRS